jgi:CDGSH-type Zn-finger protein
MENTNQDAQIRITKNGPYIVSGHIPLSERIITPNGNTYEFKAGRILPQSGSYSLCRCGKSANAPFCDGSHETSDFNRDETASMSRYEERAETLEGPNLDLMDDSRCAFARFCIRDAGNAWELTEGSDNAEYRAEAIKAASDCPAGRLVAVSKDGDAMEPEYTPAVDIIQDPEKGVSGGVFVRGYIPIVSQDGQVYEVRNRVALCRCGKSDNMPFCDATHILINFLDK